MSIFRRARLYITRKRGRSILLLVILCLTALFSMLSLTIKAGAKVRRNAGVQDFLDLPAFADSRERTEEWSIDSFDLNGVSDFRVASSGNGVLF